MNYLPTGRVFHSYVDPERDVDPDASRVHGIHRDFLRTWPPFNDARVAGALLRFIGEAPIVAHNAPFDRGFLNHELTRAGSAPTSADVWIDTLALARKKFPGAQNSLDSLCKRFSIDLSGRKRHGALVDAQLLAEVYLQLRGGRMVALDFGEQSAVATLASDKPSYGQRPRPLPPRLTGAEIAAHRAFVNGQVAGALWGF